MNVSRRVVSHPVLTTILFALIGIVAIFTLGDIAIDLFPSVDNPFLMVRTSYPGAGPESVEKEVTAVLESALVNVSSLKSLSSTSSEGSANISLEFEYGTNLETATNDIRDKLDRVRRSLPDDVDTPSIFTFDMTQMPILRIAIRGNRTPEDLKTIAEDLVQGRLEQVNGVAQASVAGGRTKIVRVELSQNRLDAYNLTVSEVAASLAAQNIELGAGSIEDGGRNYNIRTTGEFETVQEIAGSLVAQKNGYGVLLSDLGTVQMGLSDKTSAVYINGEPGVYINIQKQSGTNSVHVADAVYERIQEIKAVLPSDITLEIISDDTEQIRATLSTLVSSALQGFILAVAILFLFLRSFRSTLIISISIPFSILVTLLAMNFAGITLNMLTMTGLILGVGMIVDASIVIIENIWQYRERGAKPRISAILGSDEMFKSVLAGNLTTICVFIPLIFFKSRLGMIGEMAEEMIFTIVISLVSSLLVALFLVPVLAGKWIPLITREEQPLKWKPLVLLDRLLQLSLDGFTRVYGVILRLALAHRLTTILLVAGSMALAVALTPRLNINLMPGFADSSVSLTVSLPVGTPLQKTEAVLLELESVVREEIMGYTNLVTSVATGQGASSSYTGSISIQLPEANKQLDTAETVKAKLRAHFDRFPDVNFAFGMGMARQMQGSADIDIALRSDDLDTAFVVANNIKDLMKTRLSGIGEPTIDLTEGLPQVEVKIDRRRAYDLGVNIKAVANELYAAINGYTATVFREAGEEYSVVVMLREEDRSKIIDLDKIFVNGTSGRIALANFASLEKGVGPVSIARENQTRIIHLSADILNNERAYIVENRIRELIDENLVIPDSVNLAFEGSWRDVSDMGKTFGLIILLAIILVFGVMAGTYESFRDPFINLLTIPLMFIGVISIHILTGENLTMFTAIGAVMLAGIVVNNGIILVDYTNLLVRRGTAIHKACHLAGMSRLRPVLMTTLTTILGMIPMAFFGGENAMMIKPIGLTVVGGLSSSTFITLFFIPVVYSLLNERKRPADSAVQDNALPGTQDSMEEIHAN